MTQITPTIGRRILFFAGPDAVLPEGFQRCGPGSFDAGVVYVWSDTCVNLDVCDHAGNHFPFTSIVIRDEGEEKATYECWAQWMPYQMGQAAKTEQVSGDVRAVVDGLVQILSPEQRDRLACCVGGSMATQAPAGPRIPAGARVFFTNDGDTTPHAGVVMSCPPDDGKYLVECDGSGLQVWVHESNMRGAESPATPSD